MIDRLGACMGEWQGRLVDYFCVCGVDPEDAASQELIQSNAAVTPRVLQHKGKNCGKYLERYGRWMESYCGEAAYTTRNNAEAD